MSVELLDAAGRRRSPATLPGRRRGCTPRNKGRRYPADPPRVEEIIAVMRAAGVGVHGDRIRALVVVLWRAGLRISEALALAETDLEPKRGSILVRRGKGVKRREVGMHRWAWDQLEPWLSVRAGLLVGALFCVLRGLTRGRAEALVFAVSLLADAHDDDVSGFVLHAGFSPPGSAESPDAPSSYAHVSGAAE